MRKFQPISTALLLALTAGLTGCFRTTISVPKTQAPETYKSATVEQLEKMVSERDAAIKTLNAQVLITARTGGSRTGKVTEYTSFRGYIFVRQPSDLRVILQLPVIGSRALDMVSDGKTFTLLMASTHGTRAIEGSNQVTKPSKNGLENLRPAVFFDSLLVPGVEADELVTLTESTRLLQPVGRHKEQVEEPDYVLAVLSRRAGNVLHLERQVYISRINLLPVQQDIFDENGEIVTQATYENYQPGGALPFPRLITIKRPLDAYSLKVEVTKLMLNGPFDADQFELKIPAGVPVRKME